MSPKKWIILGVLIVSLAGILCVVREVERQRERIQTHSRLKVIMVALDHYAQQNGERLPAIAIRDRNGKPLLSWRVSVLPWLPTGEKGGLYQQFHLDEPWDSPHNKPLLAQMPSVYGDPTDPRGLTHFQVFIGPGTPFERDGLRRPSSSDRFTGSHPLMLVVQARDPVPWTQPVDLTYEPNGPLPELGGVLRLNDGFEAGFEGGVIYFIPRRTEERTLRRLVSRHEGGHVELSQFEYGDR